MPTDKDFKRLVRARMKKTGEAYTAARAQLRRAPAAPDYAALAGMSDAAVKKATGCTWERWVTALDYAGADQWSHRAVADYVHTTWKVPGWWAQTVTVGYERIKGLRQKGQRRDGAFEASKSKTMAAPAAAITRAFTDGRQRRRWLDGVAVKVRTSRPAKSVRLLWDDGTPVEVWLTPKGDDRTVVAVQHRKLADRATADQRKAYWADRLAALAAHLSGPTPPKRRGAIHADIAAYNSALPAADRKIAGILAREIARGLPEAENRIWHAHPVWFLDGNPIVGYSKLKASVRLLFWSGQSFTTPGLAKEGSFKAAEQRYTAADQVDAPLLARWLAESRDVQWDYKNIVKRRGRLERLK